MCVHVIKCKYMRARMGVDVGVDVSMRVRVCARVRMLVEPLCRSHRAPHYRRVHQ